MKTFTFKYLFIAVSLLSITTSWGDSGSTSYVRDWTALIKNGYLKNHPHVLYTFFAEGRFTNQPGLFYQGLFQAQVGYQASPRIKLWFGYSWLPQTIVTNTGRVNTDNQRIYEQVEASVFNNMNYQILSRSRMEERQQTGQPEINWRFRQLIEWDISVLTINHRFRPFLSNEFFFNVNNPGWVNQNLINQNRFMAGMDFSCFHRNICRVAYLNQTVIQAPKDIMSHILFSSLTF